MFVHNLDNGKPSSDARLFCVCIEACCLCKASGYGCCQLFKPCWQHVEKPCNLCRIAVWSASCYRVICVMLSRDLRQIAWYSASSQEPGQKRGKWLFGREAEW